MRLFDFDCYESMTRLMDPEQPCVIVDVGAHDGGMVVRALCEFPQAKVYAFEPAPLPLARMRQAVGSDPRVTICPVACGSEPGTVTMNITRNPACSSVLKPSELGSHYYGQQYEVIEKIQVPRVTLDGWARENGITHIDFLKVDTQGHDLEVLRGARELLMHGQIKAVNAEAEFVPEYEGATNFREMDAFFASIGFQLHQIHEVVSTGVEHQSTYCDALWVRESELKKLRARKNLPPIGLSARLERALAQCRASGPSFALYGAGQHTRRVLGILLEHKSMPAAIVDDRAELWGSELCGVPIVEPKALKSLGVRSVVLSSDAFERELWHKSAPLREQGCSVIPLYRNYLTNRITAA